MIVGRNDKNQCDQSPGSKQKNLPHLSKVGCPTGYTNLSKVFDPDRVHFSKSIFFTSTNFTAGSATDTASIR